MNKTITILSLGLLLQGCATIPPIRYTESAYQDELTAWVGKDPNSLILSWGPPSSSFEMPDGDEMFTWITEKKTMSIYTVGNSHQYINQSYGPINDLLSTTHTESSSVMDEKKYWCQTSFIASKKTIIGWVIKGNTCLALDFKGATEDQKKLQFFNSLNPKDRIELTLKENPGDNVTYELISVYNYSPGSIQARVPNDSIWANQTIYIPFSEIISYKKSMR